MELRFFYILNDARYIVEGNIIDLKLQKNLTESTRSEQRSKIVGAFGESDMIAFAPENPQFTAQFSSILIVDTAENATKKSRSIQNFI